MRTSNLRVNQLSRTATDWYLTYLTALDAKDLTAYGTFLSPDVTMQMNNGDIVRGRDQVLAGLSYYWPTFGTLEHELLNIFGTDSTFVLEALNHYTRLDGSPVTLRAVAFTDRDAAGLVTSVRLYTDTTPLFAAGAAGS